MRLYPRYMTNSRWKQRTRQLLDGLNLDEDALADALREADRVAEAMKAFTEAELKPPMR
jgi:uncharacterized protein YjiS (DUF1127 family)